MTEVIVVLLDFPPLYSGSTSGSFRTVDPSLLGPVCSFRTVDPSLLGPVGSFRTVDRLLRSRLSFRNPMVYVPKRDRLLRRAFLNQNFGTFLRRLNEGGPSEGLSRVETILSHVPPLLLRSSDLNNVLLEWLIRHEQDRTGRFILDRKEERLNIARSLIVQEGGRFRRRMDGISVYPAILSFVLESFPGLDLTDYILSWRFSPEKARILLQHRPLPREILEEVFDEAVRDLLRGKTSYPSTPLSKIRLVVASIQDDPDWSLKRIRKLRPSIRRIVSETILRSREIDQASIP